VLDKFEKGKFPENQLAEPITRQAQSDSIFEDCA
jgi:hypothetical protein